MVTIKIILKVLGEKQNLKKISTHLSKKCIPLLVIVILLQIIIVIVFSCDHVSGHDYVAGPAVDSIVGMATSLVGAKIWEYQSRHPSADVTKRGELCR